MTFTINLLVRHVAVAVVAIGAVVFTVWWTAPAFSQTAEPGAVDSFAVVARADNPIDALAAASVAGQLGAPVYLTPTGVLDDQARQGLVDTDPDVVVLAGGLAALSQQVEDQITALLPDAQVRRIGGAGRTETARLINELPGELGIVRPVLVGATVAGDVGIDGILTVSGTDVAATLAAVLDRVDTLEARAGTLESQLAAAHGRIDTLVASNTTLTSRINTLDSRVTAADSRINTLESGLTAADSRIEALEASRTTLTGRVDTLDSGLTSVNSNIGVLDSEVGGLQATLDGVTRATIDGRDTLRFAAMNLQVVNGTGSTDGTTNGEGNLIVGYNALRSTGTGTTAADRAGSHNLIVGDLNHWTSFGGLVAGYGNTVSGSYASVSGGASNIASGEFASVSGGGDNTAAGQYTSVAGGLSGGVADAFHSRIGNTAFSDG